jgi:hypothetical protein
LFGVFKVLRLRVDEVREEHEGREVTTVLAEAWESVD